MPDLGLEVLLKGKNMVRLLGGLGVALKISAVSVLLSLPLGILLGVLMSGKNPVVKAILRVYLEIIRIMPQMVLLFLVFFGTTRAWGWDLSGETASVIVFVLWGTAEMSDLVRGALIAIPKHQYESAEALGMSRAQTYWYIIIPQTVRRLIPLSINLITRMIKTTSLVLMIGVVEVIKVAQALGMKVLAYTRTPRADEDNLKYVSFEELLKQSDYISLHCPLTPQTRHMINKETIAMMKPTAYIINTGRGALIDEPALIEALKEGRIAGAGLDVQETEPPVQNNPLYDMPNVILTPHMGWKGLETRQRLVSILAANIQAFDEGRPQNVVS